MYLIKDDMSSIFEFTSDAIFEPYISVGSGESKKNSSGGMVFIELGASDTGLFHNNM